MYLCMKGHCGGRNDEFPEELFWITTSYLLLIIAFIIKKTDFWLFISYYDTCLSGSRAKSIKDRF